MRDLLLAVVIAVLLLRTLRRAEVGAYTWAWLSLMNPHKMSYGFAYSMPWAYATAGVTMLSAVFSKSRRSVPLNGGTVALLTLWAWMVVTSLLSINPPELVLERFIFVSKVFVMLLVTLMLVHGRRNIETLLWVVIGSVAFFGIKGGVFTILTGGSYRVWGPPESMLEENNALAVAVLVVMPWVYYLRHTAAKRWLRLAMAAALVLLGASVLGSQSRGALVALFAMAFVLGLKSKYPVRFSLAMVVLIAVGIAFMPDTWSQRMDTIQNYGDDNSAMSRLYTWRTLWNVALDRPIFGAGLRADTPALFARYAPNEAQYAVFQGMAWVAHSIYFQALGEHGFVGLSIYMWMWAWIWIAAGRMARQADRIDGLRDWMPLLLRMCQVSTVGFLAGGAFLSLMNHDLPLYILVFVTQCQRELKDHLARVGGVAGPDGAARPPAGRPLPGPLGHRLPG